jgi:hypothetical protein
MGSSLIDFGVVVDKRPGPTENKIEIGEFWTGKQ